MADIFTRKRGKTWQYRFYGANINGKRQEISKGGFRTKKEAEIAGNKAFVEYNQAGRHFVPSEISVADYFDEWIALRSIELKQTTIEGYKKRIRNYILPVIGKYKLKAVTASNLQKLLNDMFRQGFSRNTLSNIKGLLTSAFGYAVEPMHYIQTSPMSGVRLPSTRATPPVPQRKKVRRAITAAEWDRLIGRFPAGSSCYLPLMLGYHCGLRLGEVFGLTWDDIDFDARTLAVHRQVQEINGHWTLVLPKYESVRTITLDSQMLDALRDAQNRQHQAQLDYDDYYTYLYLGSSGAISGAQDGTPVYLVNVRENGEYIQPRVTQHLCKVAHNELGMPEFDFHTLRHTHTTMLIEAGVSPLVVQERLGHKNIQTTLGIYADVTETMRDIAESVIDQIYNK